MSKVEKERDKGRMEQFGELAAAGTRAPIRGGPQLTAHRSPTSSDPPRWLEAASCSAHANANFAPTISDR